MSEYTPTTEEVEAIARVLAAIESRKPGWNFSLVQAIEYRTERWRRHLYEAEQLLDEMQPFLTGLVAEKRAEWEAEQGETEWEYGSEGAEGTEDPDPRPLADDNAYWPESLEGVREPNAEQAAQIVAKWNEGDPGSARLIRRRKAGPWLPVPGSTVRESDSGVRDSDSEESEGKA